VTERDIRHLENDIILYCRSKNRPLVDVILPPQITSSGVIQLWFLEGRVGKISVENKGHKWFSDQFIKSQVRLRPTDTVDLKQLTDDLDWLNRNPFRQVNSVFTAGSALGQSDLLLQVQDRIPLRVYGGYENSGTKFTGTDRLLAGFNWGNAFGLDQQLNYQYTTDVDFHDISAHSASYSIPLPWRHVLSFFGAYADTTANVPGDPFPEKGQSYQASMRYSIPIHVSKHYLEEITFGFDFKRLNNNLEFGGTTALGGTDVDVDQFEAGYSGVLIDPLGQTSFGLEGYYSPGGLTSGNDDTVYNELRPDSRDRYVYGRLNAERVTGLPANFSWIVHGFGQWADERLTTSEQMGVGGYGTVRGYNERFANGDNGWVVNNELRTPPLHPGAIVPSLRGQDALQFLVFFDYGTAEIKDFMATDLASEKQKFTTLSSWGAGLRYSIRNNLSVRFDYGFELIDREADRSNGPNVGVLLSF
jgi:hemolysin activation/secretion protein